MCPHIGEIATWRDKSFRDLTAGGMARAVSPGNFHITLAFIGEVAEQRLERLCDSVDQWRNRRPVADIDLQINELGYWSRQGILWLAPRHCPVEMQELVDSLQGLGNRIGSKRDNRAFQPHITLFRRFQSAPSPALEPPEFSLQCGHFTLFESRQGKSGVSYHALQHWPLSGGNGL